MLSGVSLVLSELSLELISRNGLERRIHDRGGEREVQFLFAAAERLLPVWRDGRLEILRWGNRRGESTHPPCMAWTQTDTVESGGWGECVVEPAVIPAAMGLDKAPDIGYGSESADFRSTMRAAGQACTWSASRRTIITRLEKSRYPAAIGSPGLTEGIAKVSIGKKCRASVNPFVE